MDLEVWFELVGYRDHNEGELFHWQGPFFCTIKCPASVVHGLLNLVFFLD